MQAHYCCNHVDGEGMMHWFRKAKPRMSNRDRVLLSRYLLPEGRPVAEKLMKEDGVMLEELFNYIGKLEGQIKSLSIYIHSRNL
jgi:hypothetical protein